MMSNNLGFEIALYLNDVNSTRLTVYELRECAIDYNYMIETKDIESIIETLQEEYNDTNDIKALDLLNKVLTNK